VHAAASRWAVIRNPYMSAKLSRPFRTASIAGRILLFDPAEPILSSRPAISQRRRAQGRSRMAVALSVPRAPNFQGHSLTGLSTTAGSGASGSLSPPAEQACPQETQLYGEHPTDIKYLSRLPVAPRHVKRVQQVQRRCPWARATIASPYIRQLRYGLPLCCMHGQSREKDGAHLHNGRLAKAKSAMGFASHASDPPNAPPKGASEPLAGHRAFPVVGGLRIAPSGTMPCST
jgi:hypothetical protein